MRIPLACLAAIACISAAPASSPRTISVTEKPDRCTPRSFHARTTDGRAILRNELARPGQAQPAHLYLAIERREGGCSVPVIARQDVYGGGEPSHGWMHR